jgi:molybdenum cofactor biosynthesis enzyme
VFGFIVFVKFRYFLLILPYFCLLNFKLAMSIDFSHLQSDGTPGMVDVSSKNETVRQAKAQSIVYLGAEIVQHFEAAGWQNKKGSILQTAVIAGTMAAKKTSDLIPLCHPCLLYTSPSPR